VGPAPSQGTDALGGHRAGRTRLSAAAAPSVSAAARAAGYSTNAIELWRYPALTPVATLAGHTSRVLFLATSPDGQSIVTGAGAAPQGSSTPAPPGAG